MKLITEDIKAKLLANWCDENDEHKPVVKLFNPAGAATWLITEMNSENNDILFGLCDLGMGFPELGYVSLKELESVKVFAGLGIERDIHFDATYPLSVYTEAARAATRITENHEALTQAARALEAEKRRKGAH